MGRDAGNRRGRSVDEEVEPWGIELQTRSHDVVATHGAGGEKGKVFLDHCQ